MSEQCSLPGPLKTDPLETEHEDTETPCDVLVHVPSLFTVIVKCLLYCAHQYKKGRVCISPFSFLFSPRGFSAFSPTSLSTTNRFHVNFLPFFSDSKCVRRIIKLSFSRSFSQPIQILLQGMSSKFWLRCILINALYRFRHLSTFIGILILG